MEFPTLAQAKAANHEQLARWYRFLTAETSKEREILDVISSRLKHLGGITPAISAKIGLGGAK
jgi:hypothetical protein